MSPMRSARGRLIVAALRRGLSQVAVVKAAGEPRDERRDVERSDGGSDEEHGEPAAEVGEGSALDDAARGGTWRSPSARCSRPPRTGRRSRR